MQKTEAAMILAGVQSEENREASAPTNLHVITGTVVETSESGKAKVSLDGLIFSADNEQSIEIDTLGGLEEGDTATILLSGESGHGMLPMAIGAGGSVDRVVERVKGIEADYVKATLLEAQVAQIGFLKADSATITNLQAQTAKIESLTAEQLSAATAYIAALTAGSITAESLTADVAKVHNLTADQLSAAAGYISQLTADSVTAQNISAMYGDFNTVKANAAKVANLTAQELEADHATIVSLDSNYAHITDGVIDNATIGYADVNNLSAHYAEIQNGHINSALINTAAIVDEQVFTVTGNKATLASIDASKINVTNLNADNITVNKINGQPVTGKSISDALTQHETDISTKVDTTTFNNTVEGLNDRIDGAIETFTGTVVPTLNNTPASSWTTTKLRDEHVGDVYYVVNASSQQNGYCYRFTKSGSTYSWQLIKDSDVTAALSRLQTAEGKITTFDSDISTLKTDTGELKTKTQSLETSLGDKVDVTTFNDLSSDVEENSATITTLSNTVSQKADSSTVTTLSNTVNQVKQTADTNKTSITNLTQTVNQKADSSTVTTLTQRTSTIEQNLNGITTRVGKTESTLETVSNPNLTPFFSNAPYRTVTSYDGGYWQATADNWLMNGVTQLEDGWAHVSIGKSKKLEVAIPRIESLKAGDKATLLFEWRDITVEGSPNLYARNYPSQCQLNQNAYRHQWGTSSPTSGSDYVIMTVNSTADGSQTWNAAINLGMSNGSGTSFEGDLRLSLYLGEYSGPYKPYVDQSLTARMKSAETSIEQNAEAITLRATKAEFNALSIGGRNLLRDSAFKGSLGQYWVTDGLTASISNGTLIVNGSGGSGNKRVYQGLEWFRHTPDTTYVFSCDVVSSAACQITFGLKYAGCNEYHVAFDVTTSVKRVSGVYTATNNAAFCIGQPTNNATVTISNIKLEKGNRATDWTPAPEDMATEAELKVANDNINLKVSKNDVINQINVSDEDITIDAQRVNIEGAAIFTSNGRLSQTSLNNAYDAKGAAATAKSEAISAAATDATNKANAVQDNLDNLQIGGRNLLLKTADFSESGTSTSYFIEYVVNNGKLENSVTLEEGVEYTFSADITSSREPFNLSVGAGNGAFSKDVSSAKNLTSGRVSVTFTPTAAQLASGNVFAFRAPRYGSQGTSFTYSVSFPKLEKGNKATDWSPAPEDIDAQIDAVQVGSRNLFLNSGRATLSGIANQNNSYTSALTVSESIPAGTEVTVSCQIDATNLAWGSSGQKRAGVEFSVGSSSPYQYIGALAGAALSESSNVVKVLTGTWSGRISKTVTLKYDLPKGKVYGIYVQQLGSGTCVVSKPKLEVGNRATDWDTAPEDTVRRTQRIYYRKTVTGAPAAPSSWVVSSGDSSNAWTQKHISISSTDKYIYTCEQYEMADGTLGNTSILLDDTITVIDGGNIITHSITANEIAANTITANEMQLGTITSEQIAGGTITSDNIKAGSITFDRFDENALTIDNVSGLDTRLSGIDKSLSSLSNSTQWVHFQNNVGTVFGESGSANNVTITASGIDFNTDEGKAAWATGGVFHANETESERVETQTIVMGDWAITQSGTTFGIDYIGS